MFDLPAPDVTEDFERITPFSEARGHRPGGPLCARPPGQELAALLEAVPDVRALLLDSGRPTGVATRDLVTLPYPTRFGFWRAPRTPAPYLWITNRMIVVQWEDADGRRRTLLWEPSDHERGEYTPYFAGLKARNPLPESMLRTSHGSVLGQLRALGIAPEDVDYLAFDHLHTQDVRRLVGTVRPAPDLGAADEPVAPWFPNAVLLTQRQEWEAIRYLHPLQTPWYQPQTYRDLPLERLALLDGDVLLGPGVALIATPGHTAGNQSLALATDDGIWTSSENGVAAESWAPEHSRIPGVRAWSIEWGQDVVMNANTIEFAAWQYDSMMVERHLADRTPDGRFPLCFPSSELTGTLRSPGTSPTHTHRSIAHGRVVGSPVVPAPV